MGISELKNIHVRNILHKKERKYNKGDNIHDNEGLNSSFNFFKKYLNFWIWFQKGSAKSWK